jgi:hypothetical protein
MTVFRQGATAMPTPPGGGLGQLAVRVVITLLETDGCGALSVSVQRLA